MDSNKFIGADGKEYDLRDFYSSAEKAAQTRRKNKRPDPYQEAWGCSRWEVFNSTPSGDYYNPDDYERNQQF